VILADREPVTTLAVHGDHRSGLAVLAGGHEQKYSPEERKCSSTPQTRMKWGFREGICIVLHPSGMILNVGKSAHHKQGET
jgi:hypothetical protein